MIRPNQNKPGHSKSTTTITKRPDKNSYRPHAEITMGNNRNDIASSNTLPSQPDSSGKNEGDFPRSTGERVNNNPPSNNISDEQHHDYLSAFSGAQVTQTFNVLDLLLNAEASKTSDTFNLTSRWQRHWIPVPKLNLSLLFSYIPLKTPF